VPAHTVITKQGEENDINFFYVVKTGRVQVIRQVSLEDLHLEDALRCFPSTISLIAT
jgi:hypothetical protein